MIRVLEAISDTNIGGAGILLKNRLENTDNTVFDTYVIIPKGSMLKNELKKSNVKLIEIPSSFDRSFEFNSIFKYMTIISKVKPDIINSHGCLSFRIAAFLSKIPIRIYTRHCVFPIKKIYEHKIIKKFFSIATKALSHRIIAVSPAAKSNLLELGADAKMISVIINGAKQLPELDEKKRRKTRSKLGISKNDRVITICARLEKYKDHKCFIKAAYVLSKKSNNYKFLIIGDGSEKAMLKKMSQKLNLCDKIIFTGFVHDVSPYMNISDVNVNCSIGTETSSLALSEGMSLGIPCVASNYGGNPYMVRNGINGYIYEASNYKDLAKKIELTIKNHRILSKNSKKRFDLELNAKSMSKKTQKCYLQLYKSSKRIAKSKNAHS